MIIDKLMRYHYVISPLGISLTRAKQVALRQDAINDTPEITLIRLLPVVAAVLAAITAAAVSSSSSSSSSDGGGNGGLVVVVVVEVVMVVVMD